MDQSLSRVAVRDALAERGFTVKHESAAVSIYVHPQIPDLVVRVGTTRAVGERGGAECYRAPISEFVLDDLLGQVGAFARNADDTAV